MFKVWNAGVVNRQSSIVNRRCIRCFCDRVGAQISQITQMNVRILPTCCSYGAKERGTNILLPICCADGAMDSSISNLYQKGHPSQPVNPSTHHLLRIKNSHLCSSTDMLRRWRNGFFNFEFMPEKAIPVNPLTHQPITCYESKGRTYVLLPICCADGAMDFSISFF